MHVLICTDGSSSSLEGIKCMLEVFGKEHAYTVLFVLSEDGIYGRYKETFEEDLERIEKIFGDLDPEKTAARDLVLKPLLDYMSHAGFNATAKVREGGVISEILEEIDEGQYDVTVLAEEKLSISKVLPGSTLHEVAQNVKGCLLIVKAPSHDAHA